MGRLFLYALQQRDEPVDLFRRVEGMNDDAQTLAAPGNGRVQDRADVQPPLLQAFSHLPDSRIAGNDEDLYRRSAVQPFVTDSSLLKPVDELLESRSFAVE